MLCVYGAPEELGKRGDMAIFMAGDPATNEVTGEGYMTNMLAHYSG